MRVDETPRESRAPERASREVQQVRGEGGSEGEKSAVDRATLVLRVLSVALIYVFSLSSLLCPVCMLLCLLSMYIADYLLFLSP